MPQQSKIFRVFVSSTFRDMKEERWILQKDVFPKLEKFCEENGARFQAVDLRWGVNEESQLNQIAAARRKYIDVVFDMDGPQVSNKTEQLEVFVENDPLLYQGIELY